MGAEPVAAAAAPALAAAAPEAPPARVETLAARLLEASLDESRRNVDRRFGVLLLCQWAAAVGLAAFVSPHAWRGTASSIHPHVWSAVLLGGVITSLPLALIRWLPGSATTRHVVAVAQMLWSALLIHLTGGRIETHFHVFGSLAFIAYYRDARVLSSASLVVALDHLLRGLWWPESVYGVIARSDWRWLEHTFWVVFEGVVLLAAIRSVLREQRAIALDRARLEVAAEELARSNSDLERFAYVSSHDLQEPLRMVISWLGLFERRYRDGLEPQARQWIEHASTSALRMHGLVNDLLAYARIGQVERAAAPTSTREALDAALANLQSAIAESGAKIEVGDLPPSRIAGERLAQVFQNLVGNAIKYRRGPPRVQVRGDLRGVEAVFAVVDDGIGIAPEHHERVFELFQRLHRRDEFPGTGLGLAICKRIVEAHGGRMWLESAPGRGSTFWFSLPA